MWMEEHSHQCIEKDCPNGVFVRGGLFSDNGKHPIGKSVHKKVSQRLKISHVLQFSVHSISSMLMCWFFSGFDIFHYNNTEWVLIGKRYYCYFLNHGCMSCSYDWPSPLISLKQHFFSQTFWRISQGDQPVKWLNFNLRILLKNIHWFKCLCQ
jgi:hypothetical protein